MKPLRDATDAFTLGDWTVRPRQAVLERGEVRASLEPKHLDVLLCLVEGAGDVVSIDRLLDRCWPGEFHGDNPVHKSIAMLRKVLGDDARAPRYVATVRKRGYRIVAPITDLTDRQAHRCGSAGAVQWLFDGARVCRPMATRHAARWLQNQACFAVTLSYTRPVATMHRAPPRDEHPEADRTDDSRSTRTRSATRAALLLCMSSTILSLTLCTWLAAMDARRAIARADALHRRAEAIIACHDRRMVEERPKEACADPRDKRKGP
jgi:DNA-binding winged helix-turn-helix (wHTH) protein